MCSIRQYLLLSFLLLYLHGAAQKQVPVILQPFLLTETSISANKVNSNSPGIGSFYALEGPVPNNATVVRALAPQLNIVSFGSAQAKVLVQLSASFLSPVNNKWKLSPALLQRYGHNHLPGGRLRLLISVYNTEAFLSRYKGLQVISVDQQRPLNGSLLLETPGRAWLDTLLADTLVHFISLAAKPFTERELTGFDLSANKINLAHRLFPSINGGNLMVSVKENRPDTLDVDLTGRYRYSPAASASMQTHATTMATIIAGGGNSFYTGLGVAWGVLVSSSDFANLLPDHNQEIQRLNVTVQNHSYGVGIENYYGADAAAYDAQAAQHLSLLHVFSAGNLGTQSSPAGNYAGISGYANLSGSFKMAKNNLTVGSADSFGVVPALSSRGPACDGRLKPELVALGEDGSSGAAAIVSGTAILIQDFWLRKKTALPASSLVKAVLINSATDVGAKGIDFVSGYGNVNAFRALQTISQDQVMQGTVQQGQTITHPLTVPANAKNLKITLCWTDPPGGQPNSYKALVNDLDIELRRPLSAESWLPWVLNSAANADSLKQLPVRKKDDLNTVEQITIDDPAPGNYELLVKGFAVDGTQPYAVAWQYDTLDHFLFTFPVKGDNIFPRQTHTIRWETTLPGNATLQYRINNGNWNTISSAVALNKNYFQWQAPDTAGALQLKMLAGARSWYSDTVSLSQNLIAGTGFNCVDSFLLYWQRASVDSYRVYRLGDKYLELFKTVADTALLQYKSVTGKNFYSVAPVLPMGVGGVKGYGFDYTQQQVGCYISSFVADPVNNHSASLQLQLGTVFNVDRVIFEKLTAGGFRPVYATTPVTNRQILRTEAATSGLNTYRAKVELKSGTVYYSQPAQVYIFAGQTFYVFPNPVKQGMPLNFLTADTDDMVIAVFDQYGKKLASHAVTGFLNSVQLPVLQKGIYYYSIYKAGVRQQSNPFVVY